MMLQRMTQPVMTADVTPQYEKNECKKSLTVRQRDNAKEYKKNTPQKTRLIVKAIVREAMKKGINRSYKIKGSPEKLSSLEF